MRAGLLSRMNVTTQSLDPQAFNKLRQLVEEIDIAMITTVTHDGALHSRPMVTRELSDDGHLWFFTADNSGKAHDLAEEQSVNVSYADSSVQRYVSITGNATIVHDAVRARELWEPHLNRYFPRGLDDPHLALIDVRVETAEYWDFSPEQSGSIKEHPANQENRDGGRGDHTRVDIRATPASG